jgi:hypothetical protein
MPGAQRGGIVQAARADRPQPQQPPPAIADGGRPDRVLLLFAGYERAAAWPVRRRAPDLHLGAADAQVHALGRGISEHLGQRASRSPGSPGTAKPHAVGSGRISCTARVTVE